MSSAVQELHPYLINPSTWVFDDPTTNLHREPFVSGISEMISEIVRAKGIDGSGGITIQFSQEPFEGCDAVLDWVRPGDPDRHFERDSAAWNRSGNWYRGEVNGTIMEGWLCPALGKYFSERPLRIAVKITHLREGVDPIWNPAPGTMTTRFVQAPE